MLTKATLTGIKHIMASKPISSSSWETSPPNFLSITPLDGRNYHKLKPLSGYFSEFALNRQRVRLEINYLIFLSTIGVAPKLSKPQTAQLKKLAASFNLQSINQIRSFEKKTNHDIKAVEYYLKSQLTKLRLKSHLHFIHWGLTSEDINNLSYNLNIKSYQEDQLTPLVLKVTQSLKTLILKSNQPMLARTHGQPAGVTTLAKELTVFYQRLTKELAQFTSIKLSGKITGAVGSLADQHFSYPNKNWLALHSKFIKQLGLSPKAATTQILPYDSLIQVFDSTSRLQNIALDLTQNLWWYTSLGYLTQINHQTQIGSSVMPQKLNPIYLEGAEGGFGISNSLFAFYKQKLSRSRLQRDLSDSTVRRSFGIAFAYSHLSFQSLAHALTLISPNKKVIAKDLDKHWEILTSTVQTFLRTKTFNQAYEVLAKKVKGKTLSKAAYTKLINSLSLNQKTSTKLKSIDFDKLTQPSQQIVTKILKK